MTEGAPLARGNPLTICVVFDRLSIRGARTRSPDASVKGRK